MSRRVFRGRPGREGNLLDAAEPVARGRGPVTRGREIHLDASAEGGGLLVHPVHRGLPLPVPGRVQRRRRAEPAPAARAGPGRPVVAQRAAGGGVRGEDWRRGGQREASLIQRSNQYKTIRSILRAILQNCWP